MPSNWIDKQVRLDLYLRDRYLCYCCGRKCTDSKGNMQLDKKRFITLDHIIPHSRTKKHKVDNLVVACNECNSTRNNMSIKEYCILRGFNWIVVYNRIMKRKRVYRYAKNLSH